MTSPMKRFFILNIIILSTFAATFAPSVVHAEIIDKIAARINREIVTVYDLEQSAIPFLLQEGRNPAVLENEKERPKVLLETLNDLIDRKLIVQEAKKIELKVDDARLEQWLAFTRQQRKLDEDQFQEMIEGFGVPYKKYKEMVRENLTRIDMVRIKIGSQISVSQADVDRVFAERYGADGGKEKYITVAHILIQPESDSDADLGEAKQRASIVLNKLKAGEDFAIVAKEMSDGPTGTNGGELGTYKRGDLDPDFEKVAYGLKVGQRSKIVKTKFGFHIIKVSEIELREAPDIEQRKDRLQMELRAVAAERLLKDYTKQLRSRSSVDVRYP